MRGLKCFFLGGGEEGVGGGRLLLKMKKWLVLLAESVVGPGQHSGGGPPGS